MENIPKLIITASPAQWLWGTRANLATGLIMMMCKIPIIKYGDCDAHDPYKEIKFGDDDAHSP